MNSLRLKQNEKSRTAIKVARLDSITTYDHEPLDDDLPWFEVYTYSLNDEMLEGIPFQERKLFKMGGTTEGLVSVHRSLAGLFEGSGAVLVPIADYGVKYP